MARPRKTQSEAPSTELQSPAESQATVRMVRESPNESRNPRNADVHPDEVENWKRAGWRIEE